MHIKNSKFYQKKTLRKSKKNFQEIVAKNKNKNEEFNKFEILFFAASNSNSNAIAEIFC